MNPTQTWDGIYHLSALRYVLDSGDPTIQGLATFNGVSGQPAAWLSIASLTASLAGDPVVGANAVSVAVNIFLWPWAAACLAMVSFPTVKWAPVFTIILSASAVAFPARTSTYGVLWPLSFAYALIPALLAVAVLLLLRRPMSAIRFGPVSILILGCLAVALVHPQGLLGTFLLGFWILLEASFRIIRHWRESPPSTRRLVPAATVFLGLSFVMGVVYVSRFFEKWTRPGQGIALQQFWGALSDSQMRDYDLVNTNPNFLLFGGLILGLALVFVTKRQWWYIPAIATVTLLYVAQSSLYFRGRSWLDPLLVLWYSDAPRLGALIPLVAVPLSGAGIGWVSSRITVFLAADGTRLNAAFPAVIAILCFPLSGFFNLDAKAERFGYAYAFTGETGINGWASPDEIAMAKSLGEVLPDGAKVIGDPRSGVSLVYVYGAAESVFLHLTEPATGNEKFLKENLSSILEDPTVCDVLNQEGIEYFYQDPTQYFLEGVPTHPNLNLSAQVLSQLELVATGDTASVYRLLPCQ